MIGLFLHDGLHRPLAGLRLDRPVHGGARGFEQHERLAVSALLAHADHGELAAKFETVGDRARDAQGRPLSRVQAFVLGRAVQGAMRAAILAGVDFLLSQEFEDELVRLGRAYVGHPVKGAA